jgi:hypothetical protein
MPRPVFMIERDDCVAFLRACAQRLFDEGDEFDPLIAKALETCAAQITRGEHEGYAQYGPRPTPATAPKRSTER